MRIKFFDKFKIARLCFSYGITNYKINQDGSIDTYDNVIFDHSIQAIKLFDKKKLKKIPIKFRNANGKYFSCDGNELTTLENSPIYVKGEFRCGENKLTNFLDGPKTVVVSYHCSDNYIRDFYGFPEGFKGELFISNNPVCEILKLSYKRKIETRNPMINWDTYELEIDLRFIYWLNQYQVIRNGNTIIRARLIEALYEIGITTQYLSCIWRDISIDDWLDYECRKFRHYKLI